MEIKIKFPKTVQKTGYICFVINSEVLAHYLETICNIKFLTKQKKKSIKMNKSYE